MSKERLEKIRQAYDKWIATPEEVKFAEDCGDHIVGIGFIGGWNTRDKEVKAEEKEKSEAVKELVMYLFDDELRDYSESPSDDHIFLKLMKLKKLFGIEIENMCMNGLIYEPDKWWKCTRPENKDCPSRERGRCVDKIPCTPLQVN